MSKAIGVRIEGEVEWHAPGVGGSDHHTLCGVDANDEAIGHYGVVEARPGQKITCHQCFTIWREVVALKLRSSDFEPFRL